ncbi:MAG: metal-sensitive transcriptional regulator [Pseudoclavibacter sp.]|nr:metal-sensitive transcriptional regulator [Pseudoclavibacter sp.]
MSPSDPDPSLGGPSPERPAHGYHGDKPALRNRLRRIEGQVRGLQRQIEEDAYCIEVLTQLSAVKSALDRVALLLLEDHLGHCVAGAAETAAASGDASEVQHKVREAAQAVERLLRS